VASDFNLVANETPTFGLGSVRLVVDRLHHLGYKSVYHHHTGEAWGSETCPTYFHRRNRAAAFHIDFCFAHLSLLPQVRNVEVGSFEQWTARRGDRRGYRDHVPLLVDFDL
jgi:hypothetical protein